MRPQNGFTLVELLVIIGIISILIAMLLPALNEARRQAKSMQCMSNLRQVGIACRMYANENKGWLPTARYVAQAGVGSAESWWMCWPVELARYDLKASAGVYRCPSDTNPIPDDMSYPETRTKTLGVKGPYSYAYNTYLGNNYNGGNFANPKFQPVKLVSLRKAQRLVLLTDTFHDDQYQITFGGLWSFTQVAYGRHPNDSVNVLLADGHVANLTKKTAITGPTGSSQWDKGGYFLVPNRAGGNGDD